MARREAIIDLKTNKVTGIHMNWSPPEGFVAVATEEAQLGWEYDPETQMVSMPEEEKVRRKAEEERQAAAVRLAQEQKAETDQQEAVAQKNIESRRSELQEKSEKIADAINALEAKENKSPQEEADLQELKKEHVAVTAEHAEFFERFPKAQVDDSK